ncbi:1,2-phenylacetyl-CoA epoxidase subunit PaaD [Ornithinimicrobium panacihumi]|uniref:1,2-phenylacetyl-CoA epoxidase subunit PaaD n=1 Tax=Ornithinimicrobium panacihumi TaxID=2008449 RepID=UPI003F899910
MESRTPGGPVTDELLEGLLQQAEAAVKEVPDPEIPVITIYQLGVIRDIQRATFETGGGLRVTITPTYSGCPAMKVMADDVRAVGVRLGVPVEVVTQLSPAWTTDWMHEEGRENLRRFGIAPPTGERAHGDGKGPAGGGPVALTLQKRQVTCPLCGAEDTEEVARFGSTPCKALRRCLTCREPFDEFKTL